ncbi:deoxyribodipyrimidine photolyase [Sphingomonas sp. Leaf412]|uniref:NAD(P)/FAD-dependent oxidoreductase n=1 Tax=Sphingomonas sp. Leaf412 TaxID=1736370 RepID=UPI0006F2DF35|nr:FAD-dependent oxidoreductase [Sphingomonas sp. Leaf412]KQT30994.1 deoxyribodipyrimidine photolyase [Sphingomonas sp. Leaf412]
MRIGVIGAGMAGLSCAQALRRQGHVVVLFDKGRGPGGRMSTRRIETPLGKAAFDHGAQYLTARDPAFVAQIGHWAKDGHVARWLPAGTDAWVGTPAMNAPIRAMASDGDVRWNTAIDILSYDGAWRIDDERFDAAIVAVPAEQVAPLVAAHDVALADAARSAVSDPCWTVMAAFDGTAPIDRNRLTNIGIIGSAVRNSAKPGRAGPEAWVLQASAEWSRAHLEDDPKMIERALLAAFADHIGVGSPAVIATSVHRWRYAKVEALNHGAIWNADIQLGACGDWLLGPRIEAAWLSGQQLAEFIGLANLTF